MSLEKLKDRLFKEVKSVVIDPLTGTVGWHAGKGEDGEKIVSLQKKGDKYELVENPLTDLSIGIPGFAVRTPVEQLKVGDLVVEDNGVGFFLGKSNNESLTNSVIRVLNVKTGRAGDLSIARNTLLGGGSVLAVRSLAGLFGGDGNGGGMDFNSLLPLLLLGDGKLGDNKMLLFFLLSQQQNKDGQAGGINPLLFLLLGDKKGSGSKLDSLLPLMLMGGLNGAGGGAGGLLPFLLMSDDKPAAPKAPKVG